jgi:hypothetical protein
MATFSRFITGRHHVICRRADDRGGEFAVVRISIVRRCCIARRTAGVWERLVNLSPYATPEQELARFVATTH